MKRIIIKNEYNSDYSQDIEKIQKVLFSHDYEANFAECSWLWQQYSNSLYAGWIIMDGLSDDYIFSCIYPFIEN